MHGQPFFSKLMHHHPYFFHTRCTARCLSKIDVQGNLIFTPDALSTIIFLFPQIVCTIMCCFHTKKHRQIFFKNVAPSGYFFQNRCTGRFAFHERCTVRFLFSEQCTVRFFAHAHTRTHTHTFTNTQSHTHIHTTTHALAHTHMHAHRVAASLVPYSIPCVRNLYLP